MWGTLTVRYQAETAGGYQCGAPRRLLDAKSLCIYVQADNMAVRGLMPDNSLIFIGLRE